MIVSNEPGYYKTDGFGIRIENLQYVTKPEPIAGGERDMMGFHTLTLAPIDRGLINKSLLSAEELSWLNAYHARVVKEITPLVSTETANWLRRRLRAAIMGKVILSGYVVATKEDLPAIVAALPEHIRLTRAESGCIVFNVKQDSENLCRFNVYEEFIDQISFDKHQARIKNTKWSHATKNLLRHYKIK